MRELRNLYGRANACVACHQNIDPRLVSVGKHPALIFELDGQTQSQTKHWRENPPVNGAQAWFVGQSVALREMSFAIVHGRSDEANDQARWAGLHWLLKETGIANSLSTATDAKSTLVASDELARNAADQAWSNEQTKSVLKRFAASHVAFLESSTAKIEHARRAERLVIALDRLFASLPTNERPAAANLPINNLFRLAQSSIDFAPTEFAIELQLLEKALE